MTGLVGFNDARAGPSPPRPLAVLLQDPVTGATTGGLVGATAKGWLFIEWLFLPDAARGAGLGTTIVGMAEDEARRRACHAAWLDTYSFQARGFYERLGYRVFGTLEDYPPGHQRFFLTKPLASLDPTRL